MFVGEDGVERPFEDFNPTECIRHQHEGRDSVESVASAVVFDGGLFCFVCQKSFYVASTVPPDQYPFEPGEIVVRDSERAFLPEPGNVDWEKLLRQKFLVVSAPMGTGKTT